MGEVATMRMDPITMYHLVNIFFIAQRRARAPLPAWAVVAYRVEVAVTGNHRNRTAGSGCHGAACCAFLFVELEPVRIARTKKPIAPASSKIGNAVMVIPRGV